MSDKPKKTVSNRAPINPLPVITLILLVIGIPLMIIFVAIPNGRAHKIEAARQLEAELRLIAAFQWRAEGDARTDSYGDVHINLACANPPKGEPPMKMSWKVESSHADNPVYAAARDGDIFSFQKVGERPGISDRLTSHLIPRLEASSHPGGPP